MATERIQETILRNLIFTEEYYRKVVPFLKEDYFEEYHEKVIFEEISDFASKYDKVPTQEVLAINVQNRNDLTDETFRDSLSTIRGLTDEWVDYEWLLDATEKWCQDRAIYLALMSSIKIADGGDKKISKDAIPGILQEALAVSFDEHIGHDYIEQAKDRYEFYHRKEEKVPFDLEKFNYITKGGISNKTLSVALAGTGVGKSLFMCHVASSVLLQGKNVLYITMEMAEEKIAERIDANLLNVSIKDIAELPEVIFNSKVQEISRKTRGKLIIKEYPTASAHAGHFKSLLSDLSLKKDFKPDIIYIDYLNICASARYKGAIVNSYTYVKAIAEELRGLAVECNVPVVTATQTTRSGFSNDDLGLEDTSESFGLPATADLMFALISNDELASMGKVMVKQLKNRYNDPTAYQRFTLKIERAKMRLSDDDDNQDIVGGTTTVPDTPAFDKTNMNEQLNKFKDFKME